MKNNIRRAIRMSIFCIPDYEGFLHTMIDTYDRFSRTNSFSYLGRDLVISYKATDFTRVFGIPGPSGKKLNQGKSTKKEKHF